MSVAALFPAEVRAEASTAAEALLLLLRERGIEYFFVNAGTDFAPLVEAYARFEAEGLEGLPRVVTGMHENLVMGMAHGAYLVSGRPQAVMFHVNVGTANAVCAALNAARENVPLLIMAGRSPLFEQGRLGSRNTRVAWGQEMFDQAAMLREAVKWEYELRGALNLHEIVDRALTIAQAEPKGPVYLTLPREILAEPAPSRPMPLPARPVATAPFPDPAAIDALAMRLATARFPVISSMAGGADRASVPLLAELCNRYGIGYVEEQARYLNLPASHPMHLGYVLAPVLAAADLLCFVECDVPWVHASGEPKPDTYIAQCGVDPDFSRYPVRTHRCDIAITGTPAAIYAALLAAMERHAGLIDPGRKSLIRGALAPAQAAPAALPAASAPLTKLDASLAIASCLHDRCVLFNEYSAPREAFALEKPGSYFYLPATGGLGWAVPAALGARLLRPSETMVAVIGDGTFMFSNPLACFHASTKHDLPVLTIVLNNGSWGAVQSTAVMMYRQGHLLNSRERPFSDLSPSIRYDRQAEAAGLFGVRVERTSELLPAIRSALEEVEVRKRSAVVDIICH